MDNIHPRDLPAFLDPALDFLADHLPAPVYDTLFSILSYGLLLASGAFSLLTTLPSWKPWEWDAQKVLPPLISILAAYYTLLSIYRTTSWMVRTTFWVLKWAVIASILGATFGWLNTNGAAQGGALGSLLGTLQNQEGARAQTARAGGRSRSGRPRPWDSFDTHQQWQYSEREQQRAQEQSSLSGVLQYVAGLAGRAMGGGAGEVIVGVKDFLDNVAQSASESSSGESEQGRTDGQQSRKQASRNAKAAKRGTKSR